jgi:hypothetical protein
MPQNIKVPSVFVQSRVPAQNKMQHKDEGRKCDEINLVMGYWQEDQGTRV